MKSSTLLPSSLLGMMLFCLVSCGGSGDSKEKESTEAAATDTTTKAVEPAPAPAPPANTIVTTHENMMIVDHKVADFDKFLVAYEAHDSLRKANGIHSYVIGRGITDPNMVMVATKIDDLAKAKAFAKSADLKKAMKDAGITGAPTINFVTNVWQDTANIGDVPRSRTSYTVKDWATWQKVFDSTKQIRMDNGLVDRVVGHDADNDKKVNIVLAVLDTTKASAWWKSDQLKQIRVKGGVSSEPKRYIFRVVKRY